MPLYHYQCTDCRLREPRLAGLDDHTALCTACGSLMLRLDGDLFAPYFPGGAGFPACAPLKLGRE